MNEREELQLGSLLHDIGKIAQRAKSVKLTREDRSLESTCCPVYRDRYSHTHVLYTQKVFGELWPDFFPLAEIIATFHHRPDTCTNSRLAKMVALADRLSSGERHGLEERDDSGDPRTARLHCLFSSLSLEPVCEKPAYFPLLPLSSNLEDHFPGDAASLEDKESYDRLWEEMSGELGRLDPGSKFSSFYTRVHYLLERFALFIPSAAYKDRADISLYHHCKATAAIATCLYDRGLEEKELDGLLAALRGADAGRLLERPAMWLIGGDISGIQDFIYSIASAKALKGLRGRSAYLQFLAEAVLTRLLDDFHLPCSNLIYSGGGHFYLLAPRTPESEGILEACQKYVDEVLVRSHRGQLALCIAREPLRYCDFICSGRQEAGAHKSTPCAPGGFSGAWARLGAKLARSKRRKFRSLFTGGDGLREVLGPFPASGVEKVCDLCGEPLPGESEAARCDLCGSFENLATRLARAESLSLEVAAPNPLATPIGSCEEVLEAIGLKLRLFRPGETSTEAYLLNRTDFILKERAYLGFRFLASHTPMRSGEVVTLEGLAEEATGIKKWGVVRADVDNLGRVFRDGLRGGDQSISRVSMLSHLISLYFSAHVESLARRPPYGSRISIIYSGGDDLFALGSWSVLKPFAEEVNGGFNAFTAGRLTLSAGVCLAPGPGYPVGQAGKLAGEAEHLAKVCGRNRFAIFDEAIGWEELRELQKIQDALVGLIGEKAPRSLFSLLYQAFDAQEEAKKGETRLFPVWRLLYALRRFVEREKKLSGGIMALEQLIVKNLWLPEHAVIATRLADYLTRQG
ncbi:MAG: type III-A CRISPR-associated protein Cas10/Csm1 [Syntrophobacteraceae bacterium]|nr:type III-A CRISPR-associated protein Cas10/Csm1 [Syntrophobacteraceae bacterium]